MACVTLLIPFVKTGYKHFSSISSFGWMFGRYDALENLKMF